MYAFVYFFSSSSAMVHYDAAMGLSRLLHAANQPPTFTAVIQAARSFDLRLREVELREQWWQEDGASLLGYLDDETPVALVRCSRWRCYRIFDPNTENWDTIDGATAERIQSQAYELYQSYPEEVCELAGLLRFGLFQRGTQNVAAFLILVLVMGAVQLTVPLLTGLIFQRIIPEANRTGLFGVTLLLLAQAFGYFFFGFMRSISLVRLEGWWDTAVQSAVIDRMLKLPVSFFRQYAVGDLAQRSLAVLQVRKRFSAMMVELLLAAVLLVFNGSLLIWFSWRLSLSALVILVLMVALTVPATRLLRSRARENSKQQAETDALSLQILTAIAKLRIAASEERFFRLWSKEYQRLKQLLFRTQWIKGSLMVIFDIFPVLGALVLFLTVSLDPASTLEAGPFMAFYVAYSIVLSSIGSLGRSYVAFMEEQPVLDRVQPLLAEPIEVSCDKQEPGVLRGAVEMSSVSFRYFPEGRNVLQDVSFRAEPGEMIAFVGPSGSGKSTIFRILLGFEQPQSGAVLYDGRELSSFDVQQVRRQMGVLLQNAKVSSGSIYSNIAGTLSMTVDQAWEAARLAGLAEDIEAMPMGMHTVINDGGGTLSGGQRQRLLIAGVLARQPRLLLMDEATSALDNSSQNTVKDSISQLAITRILIAHRLSTVKDADRIYVLDNGSVVQQGSYEQLMETPGLFQELARRQMM